MSECTLLLQKQGKPYPRTCPTCGITGPCHYQTQIMPAEPPTKTFSVNAATVDGFLDHEWHNLMDDCSPTAIAFAQGCVEAARYLGMISDLEAEAWTHRMLRCPARGDTHHGGRVWCAFCGDIDAEGDARKEETPTNA